MSKFFTISIGDSCSVLSIRSKKKVFQQFFFESIDNTDIKKTLENIFKKNNKLQIYIILDSVGQNYIRKKFPAIGYFDVLKMVDRKFKQEIPNEDLKGKRYLERNVETKEWEYMFISSPINDYLQQWLEFIEQIDNILTGIYMLPLEFENVIGNINKKINPKKNKAITDKHEWIVALIKNKTSGYRELTLTDGRLTFTRILQDDLVGSADNFITYFRDNMSKIIDYLKRFYPNFSSDDLTIYIITNTKEKEIIIKSALKEFRIKAFSFFELASILNLDRNSYKNDQYGDNLFQDLTIRNKKVVNFLTNKMKQLSILSMINKVFIKFIFALLFTLIILFLLSSTLLIKNRIGIENIKSELKIAEDNLAKKKETQFNGKVTNDIDKIIDISSFYADVIKINGNPFDLLAKFSEISAGNIIISGLTWKIDNFRKNNFNIRYNNTYQIDSLLINKSGKIDDLFKLYENMDKTFRTSFKNYTIRMSNLPKNIDFNTNYFSFPLKIDINGGR